MHACGYSDKSGSPSLDDKGYQISKDADYGPGNQYKDQYSGYPFFKVCVLAKKVSCIKKETNKKDNPENDREDDPYGVRNIVYGIFDTSNLGVGWCC